MAENLYGGSAINLYADPGLDTLEHCHEDMNGFVDYVAKFHAPNFRAFDDDVRRWRFDRDQDDWQGWMGVDSVRTHYHSGHGGVNSSGRFEAPMGRSWDGTSVFSTQMGFGDTRLRYLFLSTCDSVRTLFGDSPWRTWNTPNRGARMLFGFSSTSGDWWAYGMNFFQRWNTGTSFSQAWQESSFSLTSEQIVASTACGATAREAQDRLWHERMFSGGAVRDDWYWWRWAGTLPDGDMGFRSVEMPERPVRLRLSRRRGDLERVIRLARSFDVEAVRAEPAAPSFADRDDRRRREEDDGRTPRLDASPRLVLGDDDAVTIVLGELDLNLDLVSEDDARSSADETVRRLDPDGRLDLVFDRVCPSFHAGASSDGDVVEPDIGDRTVFYRQRVDGIAAAMGGDGHVAVTVDRSGRPVRIVDRSVEVVEQAEAAPREPDGRDIEGAREALDAAQARRFDPCGRSVEVSSDPERDEIGYRFRDEDGVLVARRVVTVTAGGFQKLHHIEVPLT